MLSPTTIVTLLADAAHPNGYYPTCADLIEVTASLVTPGSGAGITDEFADENTCGPIPVRLYLEPRPQATISIAGAANKGADNALFTTATISLATSPMMGNLSAASYVWEREILRRPFESNPPPPYITIAPWATIATGATVTSTFTQTGLQDGDIIRIRCTMTGGNTLWDCPTMISSTAQVTVQEYKSPTFVALASKAPSGSTASGETNQNGVNVSIATTSDDSRNQTQIHTVDLLTLPNPADAQVAVRFWLLEDATVTVEVVDALKRVVLLPINAEERRGGGHEIMIPLATLPSGVYSVRVRATLKNGKILMQQRQLIIAR
jgi:hypothetical protein